MILSLSHIDLDGYVCQFILQKEYGNIVKYNTNYNKINEYIDIIHDKLSYDRTISMVYITDLSFNQDQYSYFIRLVKEFPDINFVFIDHHPRQFEVVKCKNIIHVIKETKSASLQLAEHFDGVTDFVEAVNAFDTWQTDSKYFKYGLMLNTLFWDYKAKRFSYVFKDMHKPSQREVSDYKEILEKKNKHFETLRSKGLLAESKGVLISFTDKYLNWIQLDYPNKLYYINATSYGTINVRISEEVEEQKTKELKKQIAGSLSSEEWFVDMGGHDRAFGISHNEHNDHNVIVECVKMIFEDIKRIEGV